MAEVSTERSGDIRLIGYLEGWILPQAEKKGISWRDKMTNVVERLWNGEVTRDSAWDSQTKEAPEGEGQYYLVVTAAYWEEGQVYPCSYTFLFWQYSSLNILAYFRQLQVFWTAESGTSGPLNTFCPWYTFALYLHNLLLLPRVLLGWKEDLFSHGYNIIKDK